MNYLEKYPKLTDQLRELTIEHNFCEKQFSMFLSMGIRHQPSLADEIIRSFSDREFSWKEILNSDTVGEVFDCDTEEEARDFAETMFLDPAKAFKVRENFS